MNYKTIQCDLSVFDGRLSYMRCAQQLLSVLVFLRETQSNTLTVSTKELVEALSDSGGTVSARTVRGWLNILAKNGAIKYKYSGKMIINPYYVFDGTEDDFFSAVKRWEEFKSDVAEVEMKKAL